MYIHIYTYIHKSTHTDTDMYIQAKYRHNTVYRQKQYLLPYISTNTHIYIEYIIYLHKYMYSYTYIYIDLYIL